MIWIIFILVLSIPVFILLAWYNLSPQFGKRLSAHQKQPLQDLEHHDSKIFLNKLPVNMEIDFFPTLREWLRKDPQRQPAQDLAPQKITQDALHDFKAKPQLFWFGHSGFLVLADGLKFLIDPMFGQNSSPHPWLGTKRYSSQLPLNFDGFPELDFALISHDHYDHLDLPSIKALSAKIKHFIVPIGLSNHLQHWGVEAHKISELDWHQSHQIGGIQSTLAPARHFSGRGLFDRSETLWGSWVIQTSNTKIYFSGDSGYGPHFSEIGQKYGPFDLALMECGQYNESWKDVHMMPEESVQAALDIQAEKYMPIHWAGFTLSFHSWQEPVERSLSMAKEKGLMFISPRIGEKIDLNTEHLPQTEWWKDYAIS